MVQDGSGRFSSKQLHSGQVAVVHGLNHHHDAGYGQRTIHDLQALPDVVLGRRLSS
jgi:hypothetical protein